MAFPVTPRANGAERMPESEDGQERGIRIKGWEIISRHSGIADATTIERFERELRTKHLPELLFENAVMDFVHTQTGARLCFNAYEALRSWAENPLPPIQVAVSQDWQRTRLHDINELGVKRLDYDWTFTTSYSGHTNGQWRDTHVGIDRELLMRKEPILFYDEICLYESELDDHGACRLDIKLRVMPSCWYVLMRYWLRVDGVLVRLKDTRVFCPVGLEGQAPRVVRERKHCELHFEQLRMAGVPTSVTAHNDPDASAQIFESIAPTGVQMLKLEELVP